MPQDVFAQFNGIIQILREKMLKGELNEIDDDNLKLLRPKKTGKFITGIFSKSHVLFSGNIIIVWVLKRECAQNLIEKYNNWNHVKLLCYLI